MYSPPFSGQVKIPLTESKLQPAALGAIIVPKPIMASPCWAEARLGRRAKQARSVTNKADFLNGTSVIMLAGP
jgi:hypothetical protein